VCRTCTPSFKSELAASQDGSYFEQHRIAVTRGKFLVVEGKLQNQDGVISVKASAVRVLELGAD
jgi:hypothetical protein